MVTFRYLKHNYIGLIAIYFDLVIAKVFLSIFKHLHYLYFAESLLWEEFLSIRTKITLQILQFKNIFVQIKKYTILLISFVY